MGSTSDPTLKDFFRSFGRGSTHNFDSAESDKEFFATTLNLTTTTGQAEVELCAPGRAKVKSLCIIPVAALTADANNNVTVTIKKKGTAGTDTTTVATWTSNVAGGNLVKWVEKKINAVAGNASRVGVGEVLTLTITKGGTGCTFNAKVGVEWAALIGV